MIEREILQALQQATIQAVAHSDVPTLPIKFVQVENGWSIPDDQKWLELVHLPNNPTDTTWGDEQDYAGVFRLILHWPKNGAGAYTPLNLIGSIADHFTKGERLNGFLRITNKPRLTGIVDAEHEILYPVSVQYHCFKTEIVA